jgi:hypothetical protein
MMKYTVAAHTESFDTEDLEEAKSVAISMSIEFGYASIIDNQTNEIIERF